jgi:hypothetical protein
LGQLFKDGLRKLLDQGAVFSNALHLLMNRSLEPVRSEPNDKVEKTNSFTEKEREDEH